MWLEKITIHQRMMSASQVLRILSVEHRDAETKMRLRWSMEVEMKSGERLSVMEAFDEKVEVARKISEALQVPFEPTIEEHQIERVAFDSVG
jgi:hypothetical protein